MTFLVILFGIVLLCGMVILGLVIFGYFETVEEFSKKTPQEIFLEEYHKIKRAKTSN